jgi:hypothetical protein
MRKVLAVATLALTMVTACGDSTGPDGEANISGTYTLRTVNGQNLPFPLLVVGTTYRLEVTASTVSINANGTFTQSATLREVNGTNTTTETESATGTWTRTNNAISFRDSADGTVFTGSLSGNTITLVDEGMTLVFQK